MFRINRSIETETRLLGARVWGRRRGWSPWEEGRGKGENGTSGYRRGENIGWGEGEERAAVPQQQRIF